MAKEGKEKESRWDKIEKEVGGHRDSAVNSMDLAIAAAVAKGREGTAEEVLKMIDSLGESGGVSVEIVGKVKEFCKAVLIDGI